MSRTDPSPSKFVSQANPDPDCPFCADLPHRSATHCRDCHASWTRATNTAHCTVCHETFSTPGVFDKHLKPVNQWGCYPPATVVRKGGARKGERVFADPVANKWGTLVWHLNDEHPVARERRAR